MKIKFEQPYLSIQSFNDFELDDFSLLTGLNGVGKTHLLKALQTGKARIEGIDKQEIVYFNYNDFVIKPGTDQSNAIVQQQRSTINQNRSNLHAIYNQHLEQVKANVNSFQDPFEYALGISILNQLNESFETDIGSRDDFELLSSIFENLENGFNIAELKGRISEAFFLFLNFVLSKGGNVEEITFENTKNQYDAIKGQLSYQLKEKDKNYYEFIGQNIATDKNLLKLNANDFESINLFASEIADEVKNYAVLQCNNDFNEIRTTKRGKNLTYLSTEEFINKHGKHPLDVLNEVLNEYDCNGYYFEPNVFYPDPTQDLDKVVIPIQLVHKEKGYTTSLNQLSSGEQTLLAIALMVYKARKGNILPRVLLLDEVDSALHPSMINKLLHVIKQVFVKERRMKVIMVTHSPSTVALYPQKEVYIVDNNTEALISKKPKQEAIEFLSEGFATLEQGLKLFDEVSQKEISIITEGNNASYLKKANTFFGNNRIEIIDGLEHITGKNQLKTLFTFFTKANHDKKVIFVWDPDVQFKLTKGNNTYPYIFEKNASNTKYKKGGIENLFPSEAFQKKFYIPSTSDEGGHYNSFDKKKFENHMIANGTKEQFENFKALFDWINDTVT